MSAPELPEWLVADDGEDRDFVVHCHYPRFIVEYVGNKGDATFIDSESDFINNEISAGREPAQTLARLLREAGDFFMEQVDE